MYSGFGWLSPGTLLQRKLLQHPLFIHLRHVLTNFGYPIPINSVHPVTISSIWKSSCSATSLRKHTEMGLRNYYFMWIIPYLASKQCKQCKVYTEVAL